MQCTVSRHQKQNLKWFFIPPTHHFTGEEKRTWNGLLTFIPHFFRGKKKKKNPVCMRDNTCNFYQSHRQAPHCSSLFFQLASLPVGMEESASLCDLGVQGSTFRIVGATQAMGRAGLSTLECESGITFSWLGAAGGWEMAPMRFFFSLRYLTFCSSLTSCNGKVQFRNAVTTLISAITIIFGFTSVAPIHRVDRHRMNFRTILYPWYFLYKGCQELRATMLKWFPLTECSF